MKSINFYLLIIFVLIFHVSCISDTTRFNYNPTNLVSKHRNVLDKLYEHYKSPHDSLKLKAAEFLINNSTLDYVYHKVDSEYDSIFNQVITFNEDTVDSIYVLSQVKRLSSYFEKTVTPFRAKMNRKFGKKTKMFNLDNEEILGSLRYYSSILHSLDLLEQYEKKMLFNISSPVSDLNYFDADYIINNIENAFMVWNYPWNNFLEFEEFCRLILPYRAITSYYSFTDREEIRKYFSNEITEAINKELSLEEFLNIINVKIDQTVKPFDLSYIKGYSIGFKNILVNFDTKKFSCLEKTDMYVAIYRALGIPTSIEAGIRQGMSATHHWINTPTSQRNFNPRNAGTIYDSDKFSNNMNYEKVYRCNHLLTENSIFQYLGKKDRVPNPLFNGKYTDVTNEYFNTHTVKIPVNKRKHHQLAYLCTFSRGSWNYIAWAPIKKGQATFGNLRSSILLFPGYYSEDGFISAGNPIQVDNNGIINKISLSSAKQSVHLLRKDPERIDLQLKTKAFIGSKIWGSNSINFNEKVLLAKIDSA